MYIKETKKTVKNQNGDLNTYSSYYLVEKVYSPSLRRYIEHTILNLSPCFPVPRSKWPALLSKIKAGLYPSPSRGLFADEPSKDPELDDIAARIVEAIKQKESTSHSAPPMPQDESVQVKDIISKSAKTAGGEILALQALEQLGFDKILTENGFSPRERRIAHAQVVGRMLYPTSEDGTSRWLMSNSAIKKLLGLTNNECNPMALHRVADKIGACKENIENSLFNTPSLFCPHKVLILYDLTNIYLQGDYKDNPMAKRGFSKEKRFDRPLITVGVSINNLGFIVKSDFHAGNVSEPTTFIGLIESVNLTKGDIVIMDKGIATKENLEWLANAGMFFIVADRRTKREFDPELAKEFETPAGSKIDGYLIDDNTRDGLTKLLCHSKDREAKENAMIDTASKKLEAELTKIHEGLSRSRTVKLIDAINRRIGRLIEKYSVSAQYYTISVIPSESNPKLASAVHFERKEIVGSKGELPGVYCILTNHPTMKDEEILNTYLKLTEVESVFRCLKSELGLRPVFHKRGDRVLKHLFISLLAYQAVNCIRISLRKCGIHDSWNTIRKVAEEQKQVVLIAKANLRYGKAVMIENLTCLTGRLEQYYKAMKINRNVMKQHFTYVSMDRWHHAKAMNW
ncbi:MAG: IS1634 family transposase [Rickettsiales bacterium]|jgi:transposase|nr:IS1634 family transposase [Rickettsiales bacterium]